MPDNRIQGRGAQREVRDRGRGRAERPSHHREGSLEGPWAPPGSSRRHLSESGAGRLPFREPVRGSSHPPHSALTAVRRLKTCVPLHPDILWRRGPRKRRDGITPPSHCRLLGPQKGSREDQSSSWTHSGFSVKKSDQNSMESCQDDSRRHNEAATHS